METFDNKKFEVTFTGYGTRGGQVKKMSGKALAAYGDGEIFAGYLQEIDALEVGALMQIRFIAYGHKNAIFVERIE